jgi:hypothetical protein
MTLSVSPGLTVAETKDCADKLVNTRSQTPSSTSKPDMKRDLMPRKESTGTPATGLLQFERDDFTSLCSPAAPYKEEAYWLEKSGFKIVDLKEYWGLQQSPNEEVFANRLAQFCKKWPQTGAYLDKHTMAGLC